jgi:hypothetical protein
VVLVRSAGFAVAATRRVGHLSWVRLSTCPPVVRDVESGYQSDLSGSVRRQTDARITAGLIS